MFIMSKWFIVMDFLWYQKNYGWKTAQEHNEDVHERKTSQCQCISINMAQQQMQPTTKKPVNEFKESFFFGREKLPQASASMNFSFEFCNSGLNTVR